MTDLEHAPVEADHDSNGNGTGNGPASPPPDLRTLQGLMQHARAAHATRETIDLLIPGYQIDTPGYGEGRLYGRFRALDDYREARRIDQRHAGIKDAAKRELEIGGEMLVAASIDTFIRLDDGDGVNDVPVGMPLGARLAAWLGLCGENDGVSDVEAAFMIFPDTMKLAVAARQVVALSEGAGTRADQELAKN